MENEINLYPINHSYRINWSYYINSLFKMDVKYQV